MAVLSRLADENAKLFKASQNSISIGSAVLQGLPFYLNLQNHTV